jgi:WD40 repeat protein
LSTLKRRLERGRTLLAQRISRRGLVLASVSTLTLLSRRTVSAQLVRQAVATAGQVAAGKAVAGTAAALADGLQAAIVLKQMSVALILFVSVSSFTLTAGWAIRVGAQTPPATTSAVSHPPARVGQFSPAPHVDQNGDPLPEGAINRIGSSRFRHGGYLRHFAYTKDGKGLVTITLGDSANEYTKDGKGPFTTTWNNATNFWDVKTGKRVWRSELGKDTFIPALAMSEDGKKVAVLGEYDYRRIATDTGEILAKHSWEKTGDRLDEVPTGTLAFTSDLQTRARGLGDATVRLYDAVSGAEKMRFSIGDPAKQEFAMGLRFSADGQTIFVTGCHFNGIAVHDTSTGRRLRTLEAESYGSMLSLCDNRGLIATYVNPSRPSPNLYVWNTHTAKWLYRIPHAGYGMAFSPDGAMLAVATDADDVLLLDALTGQEQRRIHWSVTGNDLAFSPDGKTLAASSSTGSLALWDVATGTLLPPSPTPSRPLRLQFTERGKQLLVVSDTLEWWNLENGKQMRAAQLNQEAFAWGTSVSPDGKLAAVPVGKSDRKLLIETATGDTVRTLTGAGKASWGSHRSATFSADGSTVYSTAEDGGVIAWNAVSGRVVGKLESQNNPVRGSFNWRTTFAFRPRSGCSVSWRRKSPSTWAV